MQQEPSQDASSLRIALNAMPVAVSWATLSDQKIIFINRKFTELFGYSPGEFSQIADWINYYPFEEDRVLATERWSAYLTSPTGEDFLLDPMELRIRCKDGTVKTLMHHGVILPDAGWALATFVDISGRKRNEIFLREAGRQARESQAIYSTLLDHSPEMIILSPFNNGRRYVSPAVLKVTGFTAEEYLAYKPADLVHPEDLETAKAASQAIRNGERSQMLRYRTLQKEGGYRWVEAMVNAYFEPGSDHAAGYVVTVRDIAEEVEREQWRASEYQRLTAAASLDELTGIANRRTFNLTLSREALRQSRSTREMSLLLLDVDNFKQYNDRFGHLAGDSCLWNVAQAIEGIAGRNADLVARFGGEEFVILAPLTTLQGAEFICQRILAAVAGLELEHPDSAHGVVTVSIGVTSWPPGRPVDQAALLEKADRALYLAKAAGRNNYQVLAFEETP